MGRVKNIFSIILILTFSILVCSVNSLAAGFDTETVLDDVKERIVDIYKLEFVKEEPKIKRAVEFVTVNNNGQIALTHPSMLKDSISVYDMNGGFMYAISFWEEGGYAVQWENENLVIVTYRGNNLIKVSPNGEILDISAFKETSENDKFLRDKLKNKKIDFNDKQLILKNRNLFTGRSSKLVKMSNNKETVLYKASSLPGFIILAVFVLLCFPSFVKTFKCLKKGAKNNTMGISKYF